MEQIVSNDGTTLAYERSGSGPPLLIIGGALADHHFYAPLASALAADFTVLNFDRRGRGASGDASAYEVAREIEDVKALVGLESRPVLVYGHSSGAALALHAAAAGVPMAQIVLADPPFSARGANDDAARAAFAAERARIDDLRARGYLRGCACFFLASLGLPADEIDGVLDSPMGEGMIDGARALPYDYRLLGDGLVPTALAARITTRVAILSSEASGEAAAQLVAALPDGVLVRTECAAHETAPGDMARELRQRLLDAH